MNEPINPEIAKLEVAEENSKNGGCNHAHPHRFRHKGRKWIIIISLLLNVFFISWFISNAIHNDKFNRISWRGNMSMIEGSIIENPSGGSFNRNWQMKSSGNEDIDTMMALYMPKLQNAMIENRIAWKAFYKTLIKSSGDAEQDKANRLQALSEIEALSTSTQITLFMALNEAITTLPPEALEQLIKAYLPRQHRNFKDMVEREDDEHHDKNHHDDDNH